MKHILRISIVAVIALAVIMAAAEARSKRSAWLGVYTQTVDGDLAEAYNLSVKRGAVINQVVEDSPADEAGLRDDDVIVAFDGSRVRGEDDLIDLIADSRPNDDVVLTIMRGDDEIEVTVTMERRQEGRLDRYFGHAPRAPRAPRVPEPYTFEYSHEPFNFDFSFNGDDQAYIGVSLLNISRELATHFGADDGGVLINEVEEDSPAEDSELLPGDVIVAIDDDRIEDATDVQHAIRGLDEGDIARVEVIRNRKRMEFDVEVDVREGGFYSGSSHIIHVPDLPLIDLRAPRMRGLFNSDDSHDWIFDVDEIEEEFDEAMEELREELRELRQEMRELRKSLP